MEYILSLNCGTSSAKYAVFDRRSLRRVCHGIVERVGTDGTFIRHEVQDAVELRVERSCPTHREAIALVFEAITGRLEPGSGVMESLSGLAGVGHRVVHGGQRFVRSVRIGREVHEAIAEMEPFAPLHIPANLAGIDAISAHLPELPQIAVFDTAFLQTLPPHAYLYGCPYEWFERYGVRRYGFHGTSHLYISRRAAVMLGKPVSQTDLVTLHIGNGISLTAVKNGEAVEHSMGLTPLDGVMMGTRSGHIDPAIIPFIAAKESKSAAEVVDIDLNRRSGLFGMTGKTDMRDILSGRRAGDERCTLAFDVYCHKIKLCLGAYLAVLDYRADAIVFSGGVGENARDVRAAILSGADGAGIILDLEKNAAASAASGESDIARDGSKVRVLVIPTNEEQVLLEDVITLLDGGDGEGGGHQYTFEPSSQI